jgi:hypothetical protein
VNGVAIGNGKLTNASTAEVLGYPGANAAKANNQHMRHSQAVNTLLPKQEQGAFIPRFGHLF